MAYINNKFSSGYIDMSQIHVAGWNVLHATCVAKKYKEGDLWLIHFWADRVESVDMDSSDPYKDMTDLLKKWVQTISEKYPAKGE